MKSIASVSRSIREILWGFLHKWKTTSKQWSSDLSSFSEYAITDSSRTWALIINLLLWAFKIKQFWGAASNAHATFLLLVLILSTKLESTFKPPQNVRFRSYSSEGYNYMKLPFPNHVWVAKSGIDNHQLYHQKFWAWKQNSWKQNKKFLILWCLKYLKILLRLIFHEAIKV